MRSLLYLLAHICWLLGSASAEDLSKLYPATLEYTKAPVSYEWTCNREDVWSLSAFSFAQGQDLELKLGPSTVVFGVAQRNVVWAAVFPEQPAPLRCKSAGDGERISSVWLRFAPQELNQLFPPKTVRARGPAEQVAWAKRLAAWKLSSSWHAKGLPMIPEPGSLIFDLETIEGPRRFFAVQRQPAKVEAFNAFEKRALPALVPIEPAAALQAYDAVVEAFDAEYAKFALVPKLDWKRAAAELRPLAQRATSSFAAAAAIDTLVSQLRDLHVWTRCGDEFLQGYSRPRPLNGSFSAVQAQFPELKDSKHDLYWARTNDGVGYILFSKLSDPELPAAFDAALEQLADCWGLILDLRFNGGGNELLGREVAARLIDRERVYSYSQYRNGPKHSDLGPRQARSVAPRGPWRFEAPTVCLQGQVTFSSAESMALMLAQCPQVTTMGDRTGGSSANPRVLELAGGIQVNLPRWNDLDPNGVAVEHVGIAPKVLIEAQPKDFTKSADPVLDAALEFLRKIPSSARQPGKR